MAQALEKPQQDIMVNKENRRSEHQESLIGTDSYLNIYHAVVARDVLKTELYTSV